MIFKILNFLKGFISKLKLDRDIKDFRNRGNYLRLNGTLRRVDLIGVSNNCLITIGKGSQLENVTIFIKGEGHRLLIGENVFINSGTISIEGDNNCEVSIGDGTTIEGALIAATESKSTISIGKDCMFSNKIEIRNGDSHSILKEGKRINQGGDIIIGNHVWVGCEAMILKNVTIGDNSIVAAKSLVSKSVASNVIVGGVPAKVINTEINWDRKLL